MHPAKRNISLDIVATQSRRGNAAARCEEQEASGRRGETSQACHETQRSPQVRRARDGLEVEWRVDELAENAQARGQHSNRSLQESTKEEHHRAKSESKVMNERFLFIGVF